MSVFKKLIKDPTRSPIVVYKLLVEQKGQWLFYKLYHQKGHAKAAITNAVDKMGYMKASDEKVRLVEYSTDKIVWEGWLSAWNAEKDKV